jgi:hypothetical protein
MASLTSQNGRVPIKSALRDVEQTSSQKTRRMARRGHKPGQDVGWRVWLPWLV